MPENDAVDALLAQWRAERPDVDTSPMAVVGRVSRLSRLFERGLKNHFAKYDLEAWEFDVLATLRRSGKPYELTAGALLKLTMVTSGAMTNRIDRLESKGYVTRQADPNDRRAVRIRLTDLGRHCVDTVLEGHIVNEQRMLNALSTQERNELVTLLRKLLISFNDTEI